MHINHLKGIIPVLLTPFDKKNRIDIDSLKKLINFLIKKRVGGFWALGSAAEDINISFDDRLKLARSINIFTNQKIPIVMGSGCTSVWDILHFFSELKDLDFHGVHVLPHDEKMGDLRLLKFYNFLADNLPFPLWMYHNPKRGKSIPFKIMKELSKHPNINGIKVGGYDLPLLTKSLTLRDNNFDVVGAGGGQLFQMLSMGAKAHTTSEASVFPEEFINIMTLFNKNKLEKSLAAQLKLIDFTSSLPRSDNGEFAAEEKFLLSLRNICSDNVNILYNKTPRSDRQKIIKLAKNYGFKWV